METQQGKGSSLKYGLPTTLYALSQVQKWPLGIASESGPAGGVCQMWYVQPGQGYVPRLRIAYALGALGTNAGLNTLVFPSIPTGMDSSSVSIIIHQYHRYTLYSYVEYSQFRASVEVIFIAPLRIVPRPAVAVRLRNCVSDTRQRYIFHCNFNPIGGLPAD